MPAIELILSGKENTQVEPIADTYRITIERGDGAVCTQIEAQTVMGMYCMNALKTKPRKPRKLSLDE